VLLLLLLLSQIYFS